MMSVQTDKGGKETGFRLSYKFRLYPTPEQERYFETNFKCVRYVYNYFLDARIKAYEAYKNDPEHCKPMTLFNTTKALTKLKKEKVDKDGHAWLRDADSTALVYALRNLDAAYQNFFRRVKNGGGKVGYPKRKSRYASIQSFTVANLKILDNGFVLLPKAGQVKARVHREVKGEIVSATVSMHSSGRYYISINVKEAEMEPLPENNSAIGITMGISKWVVTSDGQVFENPDVSKRLERKLAREKRRLARKRKGSANYRKQKRKFARVHKKIVDKRAYETHGLTRQLVNENGIIVSREMASHEMLHNTSETMPAKAKSKINRAIQDANFFEVNRQLAYKAEWAGRTFVMVPAGTPTAKACSQCGCKNEELAASAAATWTCPECGAVHDRKYNGAQNVLKAGLDILHDEELSYVSKEATRAKKASKKEDDKLFVR